MKNTVFSYLPIRPTLISYPNVTRTKRISDYRLAVIRIFCFFVRLLKPDSNVFGHSRQSGEKQLLKQCSFMTFTIVKL